MVFVRSFIGLGLVGTLIGSAHALSIKASKDLAIKNHSGQNERSFTEQKSLSAVEQQSQLELAIENNIRIALVEEAMGKGIEDLKMMVKQASVTLLKQLLNEVSQPVKQECKDNQLAINHLKQSSEKESPEESDEFDLKNFTLLQTDVEMTEKSREMIKNLGIWDSVKKFGAGMLDKDIFKPVIESIQKFLSKQITEIGPKLQTKINQLIKLVCEKAKDAVKDVEVEI